MTTLAPSATRKKPRFDNGPFLKSLIGVVGTLMTIAIAVALFKFLTGLAADDGRYRNIAIAIHIVTVLPCVPLGAYLLLSTKGTKLHKALGKIWITLMVVTAIAITFVRGGTDFSWIHIFVPITLLGIAFVVLSSRIRWEPSGEEVEEAASDDRLARGRGRTAVIARRAA